MNARALALASVLGLAGAVRAGDVLVPDVAHVEQYGWTRGCAPSAGAMVLSYLDNHYISHDGLIRWYLKHPSNGNNVPQILDWLADDMYTDSSGSTSTSELSPGLKRTANGRCGYNVSANRTESSTSSSSAGYDWCWNLVVSEIKAGRPFLWTMLTASRSGRSQADDEGGGRGHTLAAVGYDAAAKEVIVKDSNRSGLTYWRYNVYDYTGTPASKTQVDTVLKCAGHTAGLTLESLQRGETVPAGRPFNLYWYQDGDSSIKQVSLQRSPDNGIHWVNVVPGGARRASVPGWNVYAWAVPNAPGAAQRVRILGYDATNGVRGGDGSRTNFAIGSAGTATSPTLSAKPDVRNVGPNAGSSSFTVRNVCGGTMSYSVTETIPWLVVSGGASGGNGGSLVVSFTANPGYSPRSGYLKVTAPGARGSPQLVKIVQAGRPILSVTPTNRYVGFVTTGTGPTGLVNFVVQNVGGGTFTYQARSLSSWLRIASGASGVNRGVLVVAYDENFGAAVRTGLVKIAAAGVANSPRYVKVIQERSPLVLSPTQRSHPWTGGVARQIAVDGGNTSMSVWTDVNWIRVYDWNALGYLSPLVYDVQTNLTGLPRSGTIWVAIPGAWDWVRRSVTIYQWPIPLAPGVAADGDFDGNGAADMALYQPSTGKWFFRFNLWAQWEVPFGSSSMLPVPADYDGDGLVDMALFQKSTGDWRIWESLSGNVRTVRFGWDKTVPLPGDYDGDGKADLALFYPAQGRWYFLCTSAGGYTAQFGGQADVPVPADYDGDGALDLATFRPGNGTWYVLYSGGGSRVKQFGWDEVRPVPADYDGDGKADLAFFRRETATWYILYSGGGGLIQPFGYKTMIPVAADYDGDGAADIAVYQPAIGKWLILQSRTRTMLTVVYGGPDKTPVLLYPLIHSWFNLP